MEQSAEMDRQSSSYNTTINKETEVRIVKLIPNGLGGTIVTLQKPILDSKTCELAERTFVNLYTKNNISFGKGFIVLRQYYYKENQGPNHRTGDDHDDNNNPNLQQRASSDRAPAQT